MSPPLLPPPLNDSARRAVEALARASGSLHLGTLSGTQLLMERAHLAGLGFAPGRSAGGSCRFVATADGTLAVNLPRESDWELIPAWLEGADRAGRSWEALGAAARGRSTETLLERARWLGLAVAAPGRPLPASDAYWQITGPPLDATITSPPRAPHRPRVVDLSALWAGPLCGHLLHLAGADVIKVESVSRPDGARHGHGAFYDLLNQGKRSVALDLARDEGRRRLHRLLLQADIVIEAARPRALVQMGLDALELLRARPGLTWISITGYGRSEPEADWIAYGDDAGVAAGLSDEMKAATGEYQFAGDAIADPLTGVRAALAAWLGWQQGGGRLIALALAEVAACALRESRDRHGAAETTRRFGAWWHQASRGHATAGLHARPVTAHVAELGEHTSSVLAELGIAC
ncbi:MAG: CoA transferase [Pseudomonadota bacterium]